MKGIFFIVVSLLILRSQQQVLGIDFGTQFWKAALISPGKNLVIVENSRSQRKTLNAIAFHQGIRFFQDDAKGKRLKKPQLTYTFLNKLIGSLDYNDPIQGYQYNGQTYLFADGDKQMSLEQVVAMILKNIKIHASEQAGTGIRDVVLTVPANWGFKAKMSLVNAAHIAELSVLSLINENSAASIHYAISRNDTDPFNVMFFNLGSHNLQISVMKLYGYKDQKKDKLIQCVEALGHFVKSGLGGLSVDENIAQYLATKFQAKHNIDPRANKKSWTKLLVKSAQVKQILSANRQTQVYIQGLIDGIDLSIPISRDKIQNLKVFDNLPQYLDQALANAKVTKSDISSVQMIGGASRMPKVSNIVKHYFQGVEVGSHINGDESMAFGSALRAANLSLTFRVKQLFFSDPMNLDTRLVASTQQKGVILEQALFSLSDHHGAKRTITIPQNKQDVKLTVYVGEQIMKQFITKNINNWESKFKSQNITGQPSLIVQFMMSSVHIAEIKDIYLNITVNVTEVKDKVEYVDEEVQVDIQVKDQSKEEENEGQNKREQEENKSQQLNQSANSQQKTEQAEQTEEEKPKTQKKKITKTKTVKTKVQQHHIRSKRHIVSYEQVFSKYKKNTNQEIQEKQKIIHEYETYEQDLKDKAKIRNDFQSALYSLKDNFEEPGLKNFSTEDQLKNLIDTVTKQLEWLDENSWTALKKDFEDHFQVLKVAYEPMYNRTTEYRNRESAYNETLGFIATVYKKTNELLTTHTWLKADINEHLKKINDTVLQINQKLKEQIDRPLNSNPTFYNHEMVAKAESLRQRYYKMRLTPKPFQEPVKQQQKANENSQTSHQEQADSEENNDDQGNKENQQKIQGQQESQDHDNAKREDL